MTGVKPLDLKRELPADLVGRKVSADPSELCIRACGIALSSLHVLVSPCGPDLQINAPDTLVVVMAAQGRKSLVVSCLSVSASLLSFQAGI